MNLRKPDGGSVFIVSLVVLLTLTVVLTLGEVINSRTATTMLVYGIFGIAVLGLLFTKKRG